MEDGDDPELVRLRALNARLEALHNVPWREDGTVDPTVQIAIDALESEAAALLQVRADRTLVPIIARHDAAIAEAHRLLGLPPPDRAQRLLEGFTRRA